MGAAFSLLFRRIYIISATAQCMGHIGNSTVESYSFDFGAHIHPTPVLPEFFSDFHELAGEELHAVHQDIDAFADWYQKAGIAGAAISQPFYMGHSDADLVAKANDVLLEEIDGYDQFFGLTAIPTGAGGEAAATELKRSLDNGYSGGALPTKSDEQALTRGDDTLLLSDKEMEPVLEVADETGAPILVHPKLDPSVEWPEDPHHVYPILGREAALSESICRVIHDEVLDSYPNLNLVYHHLGGNICGLLGRINLQLDEGRWPTHDNVKPYEEFRAQLEERIYLDTSGHFGHSGPLRVALEGVPASNVLFATDAPYEPRSTEELRSFADTVAEVAPRTDAKQILGDNARDLLINT